MVRLFHIYTKLRSKAYLGGKAAATQTYTGYVEESDDDGNDSMRMSTTWYYYPQMAG